MLDDKELLKLVRYIEQEFGNYTLSSKIKMYGYKILEDNKHLSEEEKEQLAKAREVVDL